MICSEYLNLTRLATIAIALALVSLVTTDRSCAQPIPAPGTDEVGENNYPNAQYYIGLELYREGSLSDASGALDAALRMTRRNPNGRWIDAIPVHAMLAECFYQAGDLSAAVEQIDAALSIAIRYRGWINNLDWNSAISVGGRAPDVASAWAGGDTPGLVPVNPLLQMATGSNDIVGTYDTRPFESARSTLVDGSEILRGLATALYRRRVIFGPLAGDFDISRNALAAADYPAHANGRPLVGCVRACGHFASGRDNEVLAESQASSIVAGRVHPLSPLGMLAAARVLAERDNYAEAIPVALQAAAAASALRQPEWVCEAFQIASGCVEPETAAIVNAKATGAASSHLRSGRVASIGAMLAAADTSLALGNLDAAQTMVSQAATLLQRRDIFVPRLTASADLLAARVSAARGGSLGGGAFSGGTAAIDESISRVLAFAYGQGQGLDGKRVSVRSNGIMFTTPRLFQLQLVGIQTSGRGIGGKAVDDRLTQFVTDLPSGLLPRHVWRADHVDALAFEAYDHSAAIAAYVISTWKRNPPLDVLVQSDALLRRRFLATLPLGGRMHQIRRLAATERELLVESSAAVFAKPPPRLARMVEILATPSPMYGSPELVQRGKLLESLATQLVLERGNIPPTMPPPIVGLSDLDRLPKGTAMLTFVNVGAAFVGTVTVNGTVKTWSIEPPPAVVTDVGKVLKGIGAIAMRGSLRIDDSAAWRKYAAALRMKLVPDEIFKLLESVERVIVVPDGVLWYLPFELLTVDDSATTLWGDRFVVTYSPTPGLVLHPVALDKPDRPTGVVSSLFFAPRDQELNTSYLESVTQALQLSQSLPAASPIATSSIGESVGRLVVFGTVTPNVKQPLLTTPGLYDAASAEGTLASWMRFPSQVPVSTFLPGFRTAASSTTLGDGRELSMTLTAMHCSGVRNIVLSRWPVGGESTSVLFKEFLQELPYDETQTAWKRAVASLRNTQLDPAAEPLLSGKDASREDLSGDQPLFWAGYLLDASIP